MPQLTPKEQQQLKRENEHLARKLRKAQRTYEHLSAEYTALADKHNSTAIELERSTTWRTAIENGLTRLDKLVELITLLVRGRG